MRKIDYFMSNPDSIADAIDEYLNLTIDYFSCKTIGELVASYLLMDNNSNTVVATDKEGDAVKCDLFKTVTKPENYHAPADTLDFGAFDEDSFDFSASVENNIIDKYGIMIDSSIIRHIWDKKQEAVAEVTVPKIGDEVVLFCDDTGGPNGYVTSVPDGSGEPLYEITLYNGGTVLEYLYEFIQIHNNILPAYKYMYVMTVSPTKSFIKALSMCGFRVYDVEGIGEYVFGYDTPTGYGVPTKQEVDEAFRNVLMYLEDNNEDE